MNTISSEKTVLRRANADDSSQLYSIIREVFEYYKLELNAREKVPDILDIPSYYSNGHQALYVASNNGTCLGCAAIEIGNSSTSALLKRVYIAPKYWNEGLDSRLINHAMNEARQKNVNYIDIWTDTRFERAHSFYEELGFVYTGRVRPLFDSNKSFEYQYRYHFGQNGQN